MRVHVVEKSVLPANVEQVGAAVIGCAIEVHRTLGPGLLERLYEDAFSYELSQVGLKARRQVEVTVPYKSILLEGQRLDILVEDCVVVELKAVSALSDLHLAQVISYLRSANKPLGFLFNFHSLILKDAMRRVVNDRWIPPGASHVIFPVKQSSANQSSSASSSVPQV